MLAEAVSLQDRFMHLNDWDREQETLYVLGNDSLSKQIAESIKSLKLAKDI